MINQKKIRQSFGDFSFPSKHNLFMSINKHSIRKKGNVEVYGRERVVHKQSNWCAVRISNVGTLKVHILSAQWAAAKLT